MLLAVYRNIWWLTFVFLFNTLTSLYARAEGINFNAEYIYTVSDSETKIKATGEKINTDFTRTDQRYNLDISKNLFPYQ